MDDQGHQPQTDDEYDGMTFHEHNVPKCPVNNKELRGTFIF